LWTIHIITCFLGLDAFDAIISDMYIVLFSPYPVVFCPTCSVSMSTVQVAFVNPLMNELCMYVCMYVVVAVPQSVGRWLRPVHSFIHLGSRHAASVKAAGSAHTSPLNKERNALEPGWAWAANCNVSVVISRCGRVALCSGSSRHHTTCSWVSSFNSALALSRRQCILWTSSRRLVARSEVALKYKLCTSFSRKAVPKSFNHCPQNFRTFGD